MKAFSLVLIFSFSSWLAIASPVEMNPETAKACQTNANLGKIALQAQVTSKSLNSGSLLLIVDSEIQKCQLNSANQPAWGPYTGEALIDGPVRILLSRFELVIQTETGKILSTTPLNLKDSQVIELSPQKVARLGNGSLRLVAKAQKTLVFQGKILDSKTVFFGSYLLGQ